MRYDEKALLDLLDAGTRFLDDPNSQELWRAFGEQLEAIKQQEAKLIAQPPKPSKQNPTP